MRLRYIISIMKGVVLAFLDCLSAQHQLCLAKLMLAQMLLVKLRSCLEVVAHNESLVQVARQSIGIVIHFLIILVICLRLLIERHKLSMIFLLL